MDLICWCGEQPADWNAAIKHIRDAEGFHEVVELGKPFTGPDAPCECCGAPSDWAAHYYQPRWS